MRLSRRTTRHLICLTSLLAFVSTPLLAQTGIDLLDPEQVLRVGESLGQPGGTTMQVTLEGPNGVVQATHETVRLQYDDGDFENFAATSTQQPTAAVGGPMVEWAQLFNVADDSVVARVEVCFLRPAGDISRSVDFDLRFYRNTVDSGVNNPGRRGGLLYTIEEDIRVAGNDSCFRLRDHLVGKPLEEGLHWVGIEWNSATTKRLGGDYYTAADPADEDRNGRAIFDTQVRYRTVQANAANDGWRDPRGGDTRRSGPIRAIGIRLVLQTVHAAPPDPDPTPDPTPTPDPEPEPEPEDNVPPGPLTAPPTGPGYSNCLPSVSRLVFDGDYRVSLCYETADGTKGEARAGIYKSSQSGLLWFFDSNNAEVLIKVLDGCMTNRHRWVFMAAATDVAFNLYVTDGKSQTWSYHNPQGRKALTQTDNMALRCSP